MLTQESLSFKEQELFIETCLNEGAALSEALALKGLTYDQLRYRHRKEIRYYQAKYLTIDDVDFPYHGVPVVSFFSGAGGLDLGFEKAGYAHLASFEHHALFCQTLRKNRPEWKIFGPPDSSGNLQNREEIADILANEVGIRVPFAGVFHGGPPCQPFSVAANQRFAKWGDNFKRIGFEHEEKGNLLFDYIFQIKTFQPAAFLIENVPGLISIDGGKQLENAICSLKDAGYEVCQPTVINARFFGVPQSRSRAFIIGWRDSKRHFQFPAEDILEVPSYKAFEKPVGDLPNHVIREHKALSVKRYMELNYGQRDHLGRVDRLDPELPSKTVIAGGIGGGGRSHLHPEVPRTLSPRESARLQTFADDYEFCGPPARQLTQVGNAVPPLLAYKIALAIFNNIFR